MILSKYTDLSEEGEPLQSIWMSQPFCHPLTSCCIQPLQTRSFTHQNTKFSQVQNGQTSWYIRSITDTNRSKVSKVRSTLHSSRIVAVLVPDPEVLQHLDTQISCILPHVTNETMASKISIQSLSKTYWKVYHIMCTDSDLTSSMVLV